MDFIRPLVVFAVLGATWWATGVLLPDHHFAAFVLAVVLTPYPPED